MTDHPHGQHPVPGPASLDAHEIAKLERKLFIAECLMWPGVVLTLPVLVIFWLGVGSLANASGSGYGMVFIGAAVLFVYGLGWAWTLCVALFAATWSSTIEDTPGAGLRSRSGLRSAVMWALASPLGLLPFLLMI